MVAADNLLDFFLVHRGVAMAAVALWTFVSLCMIARLWVLHKRDGVYGKLVWSVVLLIPLFGWLFFGAFYRSPEALSWTGRAEHGRDADVGGDGHV